MATKKQQKNRKKVRKAAGAEIITIKAQNGTLFEVRPTTLKQVYPNHPDAENISYHTATKREVREALKYLTIDEHQVMTTVNERMDDGSMSRVPIEYNGGLLPRGLFHIGCMIFGRAATAILRDWTGVAA